MNEPGFSRIIRKLFVILDDLNSYGTPRQKLPNCPKCDNDELGVISPNLIMCYNCSWRMVSEPKERTAR